MEGKLHRVVGGGGMVGSGVLIDGVIEARKSLVTCVVVVGGGAVRGVVVGCGLVVSVTGVGLMVGGWLLVVLEG